LADGKTKKNLGCIFYEKFKNLRAAATPFIPEIVFIINASKILEKSKYKKEVKNDLFFDKLPFLTKAAAGIQ
jgi:hypothetical protein